MKTALRFISLLAATGFYVACSPVKFSLDPSACTKSGQSCIVENGLFHFDNTLNMSKAQVDILIVNDNSASMSSLQKALSSKFAGLIDNLDARSLDYRIAMTTTDVSSNVSDTSNNYPRAINNNGGFQDGNLVPFGSYSYLSPSIPNRKDLFNATIIRQETLKCEQFVATWIQNNGLASIDTSDYRTQYVANCPSGDNRNIFAANLTLKKNPSSFIRDGAALAIIILGDSDERDGMYVYGSPWNLTALDQPASLINNFWSIYGKTKSLSVHAITVKDNTCLAQRANTTLGSPPVAATAGLTHGSIGTAFLSLTNAGWGKAVDICQNDYTTQLGDIAATIINQSNNIALACSNPQNLIVTISSSDSSLNWTLNNGTIILNKLAPAGTSVHVSYDCTSVQ